MAAALSSGLSSIFLLKAPALIFVLCLLIMHNDQMFCQHNLFLATFNLHPVRVALLIPYMNYSGEHFVSFTYSAQCTLQTVMCTTVYYTTLLGSVCIVSFGYGQCQGTWLHYLH